MAACYNILVHVALFHSAIDLGDLSMSPYRDLLTNKQTNINRNLSTISSHGCIIWMLQGHFEKSCAIGRLKIVRKPPSGRERCENSKVFRQIRY